MTRNVLRTALLACASTAALAATAGTASATDCSTLPTPVYVTGSTAVKPFMKALGTALSGTKTVVYKGQGSCLGVDAMVNGTAMTGTASYWDAGGAELNCDLDVSGTAASIGVSDVYASTCPNVTLPSDVGDFFGPVQTMTFVVPVAASTNAISAATAYMIWGFGAAGGVDPYTDEAFLFRRNNSSGTQLMIAAAIGADANKWKGQDSGGSGKVLSSVAGSASPDKTLGIISADFADQNRATLRELAYQHWGQDEAYLPDAKPTSLEKINVRDGHYPIWGPLHMFAKIDASGHPTDANAATILGYFEGSVATPAGVDLIQVEAAASTIPQCAMHVTRSSELGELACWAPPEPCDCYFEKAANGSTSCATCDATTPCSGGTVCRRGYCEAY